MNQKRIRRPMRFMRLTQIDQKPDASRPAKGRSAIGAPAERTTRLSMLPRLPPMPGHREGQRVKNDPLRAGHGAEAGRRAQASEAGRLTALRRQSGRWRTSKLAVCEKALFCANAEGCYQES